MNQRVATPKFLQFQMTECGVAALGIVLSHYNCCVSLDELRQRASVTRAGLNAKDIVKTARELGFTAKVFTREPEELPELDFPLLVHVNFGHFVVVEGMTKDHVYLNDPSCGPYKALRRDFEIEFTGVVFVVRPGPNAVQKSSRKDPVSWLLTHAQGYKAKFIPIAIVSLCRQFSILVFLALVCSVIPIGSLFQFPVLAIIIVLLFFMERSLRRRLSESARVAKQDHLIGAFLAKDYPFYTYRLPGVLLQTMDKLDDLAEFIENELSTLLLVLCSIPPWLGLWWIYLDIIGVTPILLFVGALWNLLEWDKVREPFRSRTRQYELLYKTNARLSLAGLESDIIGAGAASMSSGLTGSYSELMLTQRALGQSRQKAVIYTGVVALLSAFVLVGADLYLFKNSFSNTTLFLVIANFLFFGDLLRLAKGGFEATFETLERFDELTEKSSLSRPKLESKLNEEDLAEWETSIAKIEGSLLKAESVSFAFGAKHAPIFQDLNLTLDNGEQIGLSGRSGAGKSTLAAIFAGLLTPSSGELFLGDCSRLLVGERQWTKQVSWVSPDPFLFEGSLRDNLSLWDSSVTNEDLEEALKDAQLYSTIMERPGKLDCKVDYRGQNFSRGQQQRLEIARALLRKPRVLILDEALDALEEDLERAIRERLREQKVSLLIISHREETLRACDRVYKLEKGALEEVSEEREEEAEKEKRPVSPAEDNSIPFDPSSTRAALEEFTGETLNFTGLDSCPSVLSLARGVGVVLRPIDLRGKDWWREIDEPILAVTAKDQRTVILWPGKSGLGRRDEGSKKWRCLSSGEGEEFEDIAYVRL
ncbi:MAG: cysteine peptidase family C39 domain-containing protein, partial [Planctomycetota bacterium]|nr:cysteine peptidase family C39 domain-containing protein [Planctomycetota bacterium]